MPTPLEEAGSVDNVPGTSDAHVPRSGSAGRRDHPSRRLDDAARAGWLYYVSGCTQDEVAHELRVSRQTAQRLVSLSISEGLIKLRLDHPIARCMDLGRSLSERFGLKWADVVPGTFSGRGRTKGLAQAMAAKMELRLASGTPTIFGVGTGRTLKAAVEQLTNADAGRHSIVSLAGNITLDGSASYYNVIFSMADRVRARYYPLPLPVIASSVEERKQLQVQPLVRETLELAGHAEIAFVGIGQFGRDAPLVRDGFITDADLSALVRAGAVGEIIGWAFDAEGSLVPGLTNDRVAGSKLPRADQSEVIGVAAGEAKLPALLGALRGRLVSGLVTDEATAELLTLPAGRTVA